MSDSNSAPFGLYNGGLITAAGQLGASDNSAVADISWGAQLGTGPNLPNIDGATPLVMSPLVVVVTRAPSMFTANQVTVLKALVERHAKEISGVDFGYTLEGSPTPVGQDGQELHMPTNSKRTSVTPTITFQELVGNLGWNFIKNWIFSIKDPDTQASMLSSLASNASISMAPMLMSSFTMDIFCIQFDPTMRPENIIDAWAITNMWPQETGLIGAKRQINHSEMPERQIQFYGLLQHNRNTVIAGMNIASQLNLHKSDYQYAPPVQSSLDPALAAYGLGVEVAAQGNFTPIPSSSVPTTPGSPL